MGWGHKAIEIRAIETGHLDGVFMHKKAQKLKFLCERNDKVSLPAWFIMLSYSMTHLLLIFHSSDLLNLAHKIHFPLVTSKIRPADQTSTYSFCSSE